MYKKTGKQLGQRFILYFLMLWLFGCVSSQQKPQRGHPASYYYLQGLEHLKMAQNKRAEDDFERALELDAGYAPAHEGLGRILIEEGRLHEAALHVNRALQLDSTWMPALVLKGRIEIIKGNYEKAAATFQKTIAKARRLNAFEDKKQQAASALFWIGVARYKQSHWQEAERVLAKYLQLNPSNRKADSLYRQAKQNSQLLMGKSAGVRSLAGQKVLKRGQLAVLCYETLLPILPKPDESCPKIAKDIMPQDSLYEAFEELSRRGLLEPYPDSTFKPQKPAERGDLALLLGRLLQQNIPDTMESNLKDFKDVARIYPFYAYVNRLVEFDIMPAVNGYSFAPHRVISGLEALKAIEKTKEMLKADKESFNNTK